MTRRMMHLSCASLLVGLSLTGIACGGSKTEEASNAPAAKPADGEGGPVKAGGAISEGATKMSEEGTKVDRK
jgi:hypothetical protein